MTLLSARSTGAGPPGRRVGAALRRGRQASGAICAQVVQALASLLLQVVALRALGADGLGVFALLYSGLVLLTALSSGLVGDSLTVLERGRREIRAGLQVTALGVAGVAGPVAGVVAWATGLLDGPAAVLLGGVVVVFLLEDLARRLLMATLSFWSVVVVDAAALVVSVAWLAGSAALGGPLRLPDLLLTLLVAQAVALAVAVLLLPARERSWVPLAGADVAAVLSYGAWRAAQQGVRPATLTTTRVVVVTAVGAAAFGELEAARVFAAPAMLVLNGAAGFLFASYAARADRPLRPLLRAADRGASLLVLSSLALGVLAVLLAPVVGDLLTGGAFRLDAVAVLGWCVYAAAGSLLMPYASLASVRGRHALVLGLRVVELLVAVAGTALLLLVAGVSASWAPYALALGTVVTAAVVRQAVLVPQRGRQEPVLDAPEREGGA
ncbi:hypothetical protein [uncultured Pseudokineococcus sp.]|uniref:hypothetical protein n=1 Tax=uncultured Pseudokineococcus sp. TaxID=1642928 RepID=UPI002635F47B|nr:hypothetical protein [uncultured Pseudokineococcus sp.]